MYTGNTFNDNAYDLDVNAALLMKVHAKNVKITGVNRTDKTAMNDLTNVRVESDMDNIIMRGQDSYGVVEFAENPPAELPAAASGKLILSKASPDTQTKLGPVHTLDVSGIENFDNSIFSDDNYIDQTHVKEVYYGDDATAWDIGTLFNKFGGYKYRGEWKNKDGRPYTPLDYTNEQWEKFGNGEGTAPGVNDYTSKANSNINQTLLNKILEGNQFLSC